jgi:hypothetical protein
MPVSAPSITAADYSDWCRYAGLYVENISHADRYRTFQAKISPAGLVAKIVFDFLQSQPGGLDPQAWRNGDVYEVGEDAGFRVEATARALEAVGAVRTAARVRTLRDTSLLGTLTDGGDVQAVMAKMKGISAAQLMEEFRAKVARAMPDLARQAGLPEPQPQPVPPAVGLESRERIEQLLEQYVAAHQAELRDDYAKFGDVRAEPGFDPEARRAELERQRMQKIDRQVQAEDVEEMRALMLNLERQLENDPSRDSELIARARGRLVECYRKYARRPVAELLPATQAWLQDADAFQDRYRLTFRPAATDDESLLARLAAIGRYDVDPDGKRLRVSWDEPAGLGCAWTEFCLTFSYPVRGTAALQAMLDAYDRLCRNFARHEAEIRRQVFESYEIYRGWIGRGSAATEAEILRDAGGGGIHLAAGRRSKVTIEVFFHVAWDDEHGLEIALEGEPDPAG